MREITDKVWCLRTISGIEVWLNESEKENCLKMFDSNKETLLIDGRYIKISSIDGIYTAEDIDTLRHTKKGDWLCKYGQWHSRKEAEWDCMCGRQH
jgi:hypothetical protein